MLRAFQTSKGFTLVELVVSLFVVMVLGAVIIPVVSSLYETAQRISMMERLKKASQRIEDFYRNNIFMINSNTLEVRWGFDAEGTYPSVVIPLPDGTYFYTLLSHQDAYVDPNLNVNGTDVAVAGNPSGLLYFMENPYDSKMENVRVYITPLMADRYGRFHFRNIYLIWTKGSRITRSRPVLNGTRWELQCDQSEICVKIDGELITEQIWDKTVSQIERLALKFRDYALSKYSADVSKNALYYYLARVSTNNRNDLNCLPNTPDCYFSSASEIQNTVLMGGTAQVNVDTPDGPYLMDASVTDLPQPDNASFIRIDRVSSIASASEAVSPAGTPIMYDNASPNVRNPETLGLGSLGGYDAVIWTCISDQDCIVYRVSQ